jgi:ABC-type Fe3+/spermidine/putrescine transport system ATPase subunit
MAKGAIEQLGTPREVYERPKSAFVADFLGESNFLEVTVEGVDEDVVALCPAGYGGRRRGRRRGPARLGTRRDSRVRAVNARGNTSSAFALGRDCRTRAPVPPACRRPAG